MVYSFIPTDYIFFKYFYLFILIWRFKRELCDFLLIVLLIFFSRDESFQQQQIILFLHTFCHKMANKNWFGRVHLILNRTKKCTQKQLSKKFGDAEMYLTHICILFGI